MYTACGRKRVEELLRSVTSLIILSTLGQPAVQPMLNVHIISDGAVSLMNLPRSSSAQYHLHQPAPQAADLFLPCSSQRLYLHEHPQFQDIDRVGPIQPLRVSCRFFGAPAMGGPCTCMMNIDMLPAGPLH